MGLGCVTSWSIRRRMNYVFVPLRSGGSGTMAHTAEGKRGWFLWLFLSGHVILGRSLIDIIYFINSACDDLRVFLVAVK